MKCKVSYTIRLDTIDDSILKELQDYMSELKLLPEYRDFIRTKCDPNYFGDIDSFTDFLDYNSNESNQCC